MPGNSMQNLLRRVSAAAFLGALAFPADLRASAGEHLPVIPSAHRGFGMETPAGSGRHLETPRTRVIKVTNLNPEGPGSLRAALEAEGPRVVVFEVSGNIDCTPYQQIRVKQPYLTVAGQTAPSPGIALKGCELSIDTHDVLIQHIRIRVGDLQDPNRPAVDPRSGWSQWGERDNLKIGGERIVIDHCSFSWATDENVQSRARNVTFCQCIFSECLNSPRHHKGGHSKGLLILDQSPRDRVVPEGERESRNVAIIGNLFAHNADRNPMASGGATLAVINNYVYDATVRPGCGITLVNPPRQGSRGGPIRASVIGNCFDRVPAPVRVIAKGPQDGKIFFDDLLIRYTAAERREHEALIKQTVDERQFQDYLSGKQAVGNGPQVIEERVEDPWTASHMLIFRHWMDGTLGPEGCRAAEPPVEVPALQIKPAAAVRGWVLANAGARPADRDPVDARVVRQVRTRSGRIPAGQTELGGWPELAVNRRPLSLPDRPDGDDDGDGYTNLEEWLHGYAAAVEGGPGAGATDGER